MEEEGVPTTGISLIRMHTEKIKPPRALWVPFELGRPFGAPNNIDFQTKVLLSTLKLLERDNGPVLEDFPEDAPSFGEKIVTLACPVSFQGKDEELSESGKLTASLKQEITGMRTWYDLAVEKRGRTTVGVSGIDLEQISDFLGELVAGRVPENPRSDIILGYTMNLAIDDLKAYYSEAVTAQPGQESPSTEVLNDWFWKETVAAKVLHKIRTICMNSDDGLLKIIGMVMIVPVEYAGF